MIADSCPSRSLSRRAPAVVVLLGLLVLCACNTIPEPVEPELPDRRKAEYMGRASKRVYLVRPGSTDTDQHLGWVSVQYHDTGTSEEVITYVRNLDTNIIGFYFDSGGATYTYDRDSTPLYQGNHNVQRSLQIIYGVTDGVFNIANEI